jgi:polyprenyl P-hydroxybenzoate/phenylacrylic acid decarboxylase-like protein
LFCFRNRNFAEEGFLRIVLGVSGASGSIYGYRLLEKLRAAGGIETHLVLTRAGERTGWIEMGIRAADWKKLTDFIYPVEDVGAAIASGSYPMDAMVVAPCSIHSMSAIAAGISGNLLVRTADVTLKERRKLILMIREMPFHLGHLRTMVSLTEMGAIIAPPVPAFYNKPQTVLDLVDTSVDRVMDLLGVPSADAKRWAGRETQD